MINSLANAWIYPGQTGAGIHPVQYYNILIPLVFSRVWSFIVITGLEIKSMCLLNRGAFYCHACILCYKKFIFSIIFDFMQKKNLLVSFLGLSVLLK